MDLPLPWPFDRDYMQLALLVALVIGFTAPMIGTFLVQKRLSLMGDGVGHVAFAGVSAGLLTNVWPIWTALIAAVAGAITIEWLRSSKAVNGDVALAILFYSGIAGGVVLASLAGSLNAGALSYLFGSILTVTEDDLLATAIIGIAVTTTVAFTWRKLFAIAFDEESARVNGLPVERMNLLLAVMTAIVVVAGMRVVGILLIAALLVLPVAAAQLFAPSFKAVLVLGGVLGATAAVGGLAAARVWNLAPGGSIVLTSVGLYVVIALAVTLRHRALT